MKKLFIVTSCILFFAASVFSADDIIIKKTGSHICELSVEKNKSRLAVYPFTDEKDMETPYTKKCTTQIITLVLNCGKIKIIDPSKVQKVMEEQEKGMTGIVDDKTAPETGKLLGADSILFGQVDDKTIQIRIIDATTGEILGARIEESDGKTLKIVNQEFNDETSKNNFRMEQHKKQLQFLYENRPGVFLFITSTDVELETFKVNNPKKYERIKKMLDNSPDEKKDKFSKSRKIYMNLRESNPKFNDKIQSDHKTIIRNLRDKRGKKQ